MFSGRLINTAMTAHASSIAEYGCVAISNNFTLVSESHSMHRQTQSGSIRLKVLKKCIIWTNYFYYFSFHVRLNCQDEVCNTTLMKLAWLKRSACPQCRIDLLSRKMATESGLAFKVFPTEKMQKLPPNLAPRTGGFF